MGIEDYQFEKGRDKTGGRAKGTRNKISEAFLKDLHAEWERSGPDTLKILAKEDPASFAKLALGTLPKEFSGETGITVRTIVTGVVRTGDDATTAALPAPPAAPPPPKAKEPEALELPKAPEPAKAEVRKTEPLIYPKIVPRVGWR